MPKTKLLPVHIPTLPQRPCRINLTPHEIVILWKLLDRATDAYESMNPAAMSDLDRFYSDVLWNLEAKISDRIVFTRR